MLVHMDIVSPNGSIQRWKFFNRYFRNRWVEEIVKNDVRVGLGGSKIAVDVRQMGLPAVEVQHIGGVQNHRRPCSRRRTIQKTTTIAIHEMIRPTQPAHVAP